MRTLAVAVTLTLVIPSGVAADEAAPAAGDAPVNVAQATADAEAHARARIAEALAEVRQEEASTTRLWPILTIALGATAVLLAATSGAIDAHRCDGGSCDAGAWQGPTVLGGAAVGTLGLLWLRWTDDDLRELRSRRHQLELDLEEIELGHKTEAAVTPGARFALGVRGTL